MKIVIAPDSFKESLSALQVAQAIEQGFREVYPDADYQLLPMADGGEGTVDAMVAATGGQRIAQTVTGPLGQPVEAFFGWLGDNETAVIEMAAASGLHLVPPERRDPTQTTSYGTGELILAALDRGARRLILGIGGSATNDGGAGMMQALGAGLYDAAGQPLAYGGGALSALAHIDLAGLDARLAQTDILVACDVDNPLCGPQGLRRYSALRRGRRQRWWRNWTRRCITTVRYWSRWGPGSVECPGKWRGGGMGAALCGLLQARLRPGIEIVTEALDLAQAVQGASLVITGEGRIDSQTIHGKTPIGVARVAKAAGVPTIALAGGMTPDYGVVHPHGLDAVFSVLCRISTLPEALAQAHDNLRVTARNVAAVWRAARA
ncbi:glycerate kinase [Edwardsiella tarda]